MDKFFYDAQQKRLQEERNQERLNSKESETKSLPPLTNRSPNLPPTDFKDQARNSIPSGDHQQLDPEQLSEQQLNDSKDRLWKKDEN